MTKLHNFNLQIKELHVPNKLITLSHVLESFYEIVSKEQTSNTMFTVEAYKLDKTFITISYIQDALVPCLCFVSH